MLSTLLGERARRLALRLGGLVARTGISPNALTFLGLLLNAVVAYVLAEGNFALGGGLALLAGAFDMLDGAVARCANKASVFGGFLDSTLDRYSEAVLLFGLLWHFVGVGHSTAVLLIYATIVGSLMISYARARAEAEGMRNEAGLLARPERVIILSACLIFGYPIVALWILAVGTNVTAAQRVYHIYRVTSA